MGIKNLRRRTKVLLVGGVLCAVAAGLALAIDTPADAVLAQIHAIQVPEVPPEAKSNPVILQRIAMMRQASLQQRARLTGELYEIDPTHPELETLLPERWQVILNSDKAADAEPEIMRSLTSKNKKLRNEAAFFRVVAIFGEASKKGTPESIAGPVEEFTKQFPDDERGAEMIDALAKTMKDEATRRALVDQMISNYPNSPMTKLALIERRRLQGPGKAFEFDFVDPIKGTRVTSASLKGKIIVADFWATWCSPCLAAMPRMKALYARYKDQGVEFIGISQDAPREEGGFDKLKKYVIDNNIEWPQYYDGKPSAMDFSLEWGAVSIPAIFVIDHDGKVVSTEAREQLEAIIAESIARRKAQQAQ